MENLSTFVRTLGNQFIKGKKDFQDSLKISGVLIDGSNSPGTSGQVLSTTATGISWINVGSSNVGEINDLTDVIITTASIGQLLRFDGETWVNWTNNFLNTTDGLNALSGVSITSPVNNQFLGYNGTNWVNVNALLSQLGDVIITNPTTNQILVYGPQLGEAEGVNAWHNKTPPYLTSSSSINDLGDVLIGTKTTGQLLRWNGSKWANWTPSFLTSYTETQSLDDVTSLGSSTANLISVGGVTSPSYSSANGLLLWADPTGSLVPDQGEPAEVLISFKWINSQIGYIDTDSKITLNGFRTPAGTSSGFLKADGTVDTTAYLSTFSETDPVYVASSWYTTTNNSTNWDTAYGWGNHANASYATFTDEITLNSSTTTALFIAELTNEQGAFNSNYKSYKVSWNYAANSNLNTGTHGTIELAGCVIETWGRTYKHVRITRPNTGTGGASVYEYNDQGSEYSPGWRRYWTSVDFSSTDITNWNTAYGYGSHSGVYALLAHTHSVFTQAISVEEGEEFIITAGTNGFVPASDINDGGKFLRGDGTWQSVATDLSGYATTGDVTDAIALLVDSSPAALNTLNELAAALGDDADFANTVTNSISGKQTQLNGTGFVKATGKTISYDNSTYLTSYTETDPVYRSERDSLLLNKTVHPTLLFSTLADYNKPSGYSTMIKPLSYQNPLPSHGYYHIIARRDGGGGYGALLQSYNTHELYHGNTTVSTSDISWYKIWNSGDFTSTNVSNWNTAYGWGDHDGLYDAAGTGSAEASGVQDNLDNLAGSLGTNAYTSYTDHSIQGYLTSSGNTGGYSGSLLADDNRTISPSEIAANQLKFGFTSWTNNNQPPYADYLHLRSYGDSSGGSDNLVMFKKSGIGMRIWQQTFGSGTAYSSFVDVWTTGNFSQTNVTNWNTAYGWGNHAGLYLGLNSTAADSELLDGIDSSGFVRQLSNTNTPDYQNPSSRRVDPNVLNPTNEHYAVTTFGNGSNVTGQLATHFQTGNLYSRGYNSAWSAWRRYWNDTDFTSTNVSNWNTAYGWGNHANAGYLYYRGLDTSGDFQAYQSDPGVVRFDQINNTAAFSNQPPGYTYGGLLSLRGGSFGFQLWGSHTGDFYYKTQWENDGNSGWVRVLTSSNIGSQSVSYATSAGSAVSANTSLAVTGQSSISRLAHAAGASDYNLELYSDDTLDGSKYVSIRFHQGSRYYYQLRANNAGFRLTGGADDTLANIYAGVYYATGGNSTEWNTAYRWGDHSGLYSLTAHNHDNRYYTETESDSRFFFAQSSELANTNLNNLTTRGIYYSAGQYGTNTNIPYANYFTMINLTNDVGRQAQLWFGDTPGSAYWRARQGDSTGWHAWEKLITSNNIGSQSVNFATTAGNSETTDQKNFDSLFVNDAAVATEEFVTGQGYITGSYLPLSGGTLTGNLTFSTQGSKITFGDSTSTNPCMIGEGLVNTEGTDSDFLTIYARSSLRIYSTITTERARFDINGLTVNGTITEQSSIRYKKDVVGIESTSDRVELLKPVRYKKIENDAEEIGLIAEDVAELFPEVVKYDNEGRPDGVNYSRLSVILLKAVQELTERVNRLENK